LCFLKTKLNKKTIMKTFYVCVLFLVSSLAFSQIDYSIYLGTGLASAKNNYGKVVSGRFEVDFIKFLVIDPGYSFLDLKYGKEKHFKVHKLSLLTGRNVYFAGKKFCISPRIGPSLSIFDFESQESNNFKFKTATGLDLRLGLSFRLFYGIRFEFSEEININTNKRSQNIFCVGIKCVF